MKEKRLIIYFLSLFLLIFSIGSGHSLAAEWTFMVYIDGDNNLEGAGVNDINEMEMVGSTPEVNIVVQFDRIEGYDTSNGDWFDTRRGIISKDSTSDITSGLVSIGEKNMGDPQTLREFAAWGMANFPANHYVLVLWNHGDGWHSRINQYRQELATVNAKILRDGPTPSLQRESLLLAKKIAEATKSVCWDNTDGGDALTIRECREALEDLTPRIDIIGFDACLMGMLEVAYEIKDVGDIMVASEDLEPDDGWPYDLILADLISAPSMSALQLSKTIVSLYGYSYEGGETQSAISLAKIPALAGKIDALVTSLISEPVDTETIVAARNNAVFFYEPDYRDLGGFLDGLFESSENEDIQAKAAQTLAALTDAIIASHDGYEEEVHGLSIELIDVGGGFPFDYNEFNLRLAEETRWDEFLDELSRQEIPDDDYEDNDTSNEAWPLDPGEYLSLHCRDDDWFKVVLSSHTPLIAGISFNHTAGDLDLSLYDSQLNLVDKSESTGDLESVYIKSKTAEEYYIQVYGYNGATNHYDLNISSPASDNFYACEMIPYQWIDATDGMYLDMQDDDYTSVEIGFDFQFYGTHYSGVKISSNGYLTFGYVGDEYSNQPLPLPGEPSNLIAPFWDDLSPNNGNGVFYKITGNAPERKLVIQWDDVPHYFTDEGISFEVILHELTSDIIFQYRDVSFNDPDFDGGKSATVGVENSSGTKGTLFSYKEASLAGETALRLYTPNSMITITEISIESEGSFIPNQPIHFKTIATGQDNPILYQYWIAGGYGSPECGAAWDNVREPCPDNSYTWTPTEEGHYAAVVYATDTPSLSITHQSFAGISIPVGIFNNRPHITSLKIGISYPMPGSKKFTITAEATGGSVPSYFQFWIARNENQVQSWQVLQDFSPSGTCRWTPEQTGNYFVMVYVSEVPGIINGFPESAGLSVVVQ